MKNFFVLFLICLCSLISAQKAKVAQMFQMRCNSCHLVPDLKYKSDQAWFGQVMFTA